MFLLLLICSKKVPNHCPEHYLPKEKMLRLVIWHHLFGDLSISANLYQINPPLGAFKCCKAITSLVQTWCLQKLMALLHCFHLILCKTLGHLFCSTFDIFPWIFGNLGKTHAWSWVFLFLLILLCSLLVLSQPFLKPVCKVICPKYSKHSVE